MKMAPECLDQLNATEALLYAKLSSHVSLFRELTTAEVLILLGIAENISIKKDEILIKEGDIAESFYLLLSGSLAIVKRGGSEKEYTIADINDNHIVGEVSLFDHEPRSATVKAKCDSNLLAFQNIEIKQNVDIYAKIMTNIATDLAKKLRKLNQNYIQNIDLYH